MKRRSGSRITAALQDAAVPRIGETPEQRERRARRVADAAVSSVVEAVTGRPPRRAEPEEREPEVPRFPDGTLQPAAVLGGGFRALLASSRLWHGCLQQGPDYVEFVAWDDALPGESGPTRLEVRVPARNRDITPAEELTLARGFAVQLLAMLARRHGGAAPEPAPERGEA